VKQLAGLFIVTLQSSGGIPQGRMCAKKIRITPGAKVCNNHAKACHLYKKNKIIKTITYIHIKRI
jgi:hypothetical protein